MTSQKWVVVWRALAAAISAAFAIRFCKVVVKPVIVVTGRRVKGGEDEDRLSTTVDRESALSVSSDSFVHEDVLTLYRLLCL